MSSFSAKDQSKVSLLFAPFGYIINTFCAWPIHSTSSWRSFLLTKVDRSSVLKVKLCRILYDNHFFKFLSVIYWLIPKVNIDNLNICSFLIFLSCNCLLYKIFPGIAKLSSPAKNLSQNVCGQSVLAKLSVAKLSYIPNILHVYVVSEFLLMSKQSKEPTKNYMDKVVLKFGKFTDGLNMS